MNKFTRYLALQAYKFAVRVSNSHYVIAAWDSDAKVWYVQESSVPGLSLEAATPSKLIQKVELAIPELLELNSKHHGDGHHHIPFQTVFNDCINPA